MKFVRSSSSWQRLRRISSDWCGSSASQPHRWPTEDAGAVALEKGVRQYQFVRRYLERTPQLSLRQIDPLIRELVHYRDLINQKTQKPTSLE